jgi:hypothetical protein
MTEVSIVRGETLDTTITITGAAPTTSDRILIAVSTLAHAPVWQCLAVPVAGTTEDGAPTLAVPWSMTHAETDAMPPGRYLWGVTLYQGTHSDATDGAWPVHTPVAQGSFTVRDTVAR